MGLARDSAPNGDPSNPPGLDTGLISDINDLIVSIVDCRRSRLRSELSIVPMLPRSVAICLSRSKLCSGIVISCSVVTALIWRTNDDTTSINGCTCRVLIPPLNIWPIRSNMLPIVLIRARFASLSSVNRSDILSLNCVILVEDSSNASPTLTNLSSFVAGSTVISRPNPSLRLCNIPGLNPSRARFMASMPRAEPSKLLLEISLRAVICLVVASTLAVRSSLKELTMFESWVPTDVTT